MMRLPLLLMLIIVTAQTAWAKSPAPKQIGKVERLDPAHDALVPSDAKIELLAEGFKWSEGPVWIDKSGGFLLFSDVPMNVIHQWSETGGLRRWLKPARRMSTRTCRPSRSANGTLSTTRAEKL